MITHSDPETNAIFAVLQDQRDSAIVAAAKKDAEVKSLEKQLTEAAERIAKAEAKATDA